MPKPPDLFSWPPKTVKLDRRHRRKKNKVWKPPDPQNYRWNQGQIEHRPGTYCHWLLELRAILCDPQYDEDLLDFSEPMGPPAPPPVLDQVVRHKAGPRWHHPPPTRTRTPSKEP